MMNIIITSCIPAAAPPGQIGPNGRPPAGATVDSAANADYYYGGTVVSDSADVWGHLRGH